MSLQLQFQKNTAYASEILAGAITKALRRTDSYSEKFDIKDAIEVILQEPEFKKLTLQNVVEALKKGGLGHYGKTYKLSTQEICIWLREFRKEVRYNGR